MSTPPTRPTGPTGPTLPALPALPRSSSSLLVRTDFSGDEADERWEQVREESLRENEDGFRAHVVPVSDPAFERATWGAVKAAVPAHDQRPAVLFVADATTMSSPDHPVLVVDLLGHAVEGAAVAPFRCIPSELWGVDNNLNLANMDWADFADGVDGDGVFRGFRD